MSSASRRFECPGISADCALVFLKGVCHFTLKEGVKQGGSEEAALADPYWCVKPVAHCALYKYCTAATFECSCLLVSVNF